MKFVITQDALSPLAAALSGQGRMAGVAAGLKNQQMAMELERMRAERDKALQANEARSRMGDSLLAQSLPGFSELQRAQVKHDYFGGDKPMLGFQRDAQGGLVTDANGAPVYEAPPAFSAAQTQLMKAVLPTLAARFREMQAMDAYGGDAVDFAKMQAMNADADWKAANRSAVLEALLQGRAEEANRHMAMAEGKTYDPYTLGTGGQLLNKGTGAVSQTPYSAAAINKQVADTNYALAGVDLRQAQTLGEVVAAEGGQLKNAALTLDLTRTKAPDNNTLNLFKRPVIGEDGVPLVDANGKPVYDVDYAKLQDAMGFAQQHGFNNVADALPAYQQHQANMDWLAKNADQLIDEAAALSEPRVAGSADAVINRLVGNMTGAPQGGDVNKVLQGFAQNFGRINPQNSAAAERWLQQQVSAGLITRQDAAAIWKANSGK